MEIMDQIQDRNVEDPNKKIYKIYGMYEREPKVFHLKKLWRPMAKAPARISRGRKMGCLHCYIPIVPDLQPVDISA